MKDTHPIKRYHQVSTDEVYGDLPLDEDKIKFNEDSLLKPSSPYSASKASADLEVLAYSRTFNLPVTISRCSNNYGPYQYPEKLIPLVIKKALKDERIPVYGKGMNVRDWVSVFDHVRGVDKVVREGTAGEIYNISGHSERTNIYVVKSILSYLNKPESLIEYVKDRPGHDLKYTIDSTKIESELGWKSTLTFEDGIKETIEWYLSNEVWLKNLNKRINKNE
jgi:dTDP-glucose 4,6-dehydratase